MTLPVPDWTGDTAALRAEQEALARRVVLRDDFRRPLRTVAGFDVGFENDGATTRAAAVLLDADTLAVLDQQVARLPTRMPYVPGLLSFRELPALLAALALLPTSTDLATPMLGRPLMTPKCAARSPRCATAASRSAGCCAASPAACRWWSRPGIGWRCPRPRNW